jgi:hypothetical protein
MTYLFPARQSLILTLRDLIAEITAVPPVPDYPTLPSILPPGIKTLPTNLDLEYILSTSRDLDL